MPNARVNSAITKKIVEQSWFGGELPEFEEESDNWRIVVDDEGRKGLLFIRSYRSLSKREPKRIPDKKYRVLTKLRKYYSDDNFLFKIGPYLALVQVDATQKVPNVEHIQVWNVHAKLSGEHQDFVVEELKKADFEFPKP